jgi:hypothetical protein
MFVESEKPLANGQMADLHFLVQEGSIRAEAVVQRRTPGKGLGLKFVALERQYGYQLAELLERLQNIQRSKN